MAILGNTPALFGLRQKCGSPNTYYAAIIVGIDIYVVDVDGVVFANRRKFSNFFMTVSITSIAIRGRRSPPLTAAVLALRLEPRW